MKCIYLGTPSCAMEFWKMSTNELNGSEDNTNRETSVRLLKNDLINASLVIGVVVDDDDDDMQLFPPCFSYTSVFATLCFLLAS